MGDSFAAGWSDYLERFHAERPGITERILTRCRSERLDPYDWCAEPLVDQDGVVLDVACGSAPMAARWSGWIGSDRSSAELAVAHVRHPGPRLVSSATALPVATGAVGAVVCSMAMQVIEPVPAAIAEVTRVLRPAGRAVFLLPATGPLPWRQAAGYLRLQIALGRRIGYPNDGALRGHRLAQLTARCGLTVTSDERRTFSLPLDTEPQVQDLLQSLYLPGIAPGRIRRARWVISGRIGGDLAVPLRRVVLARPG